MNPVLDAITELNGGFFTRAHALDAGLLDRDLLRLRRAGLLVRLRQGAYTWAEDHAARDEVEQHVVLLRAVLAAQRTKVAAAGPSAAALLGLDLHGIDLSLVHLLRLDPASSRREAGIVHHVVRDDVLGSLVAVAGVLTTDLSRTVWDVARLGGVESGVVTADSALRRSPEITDDLQALAREFRHQPRARQAWLTLRLADGRSESAGESVSRVRFVRHGIPVPDLQFEVIDDNGEVLGRSDFGWEECRHLGEFDGKVKYGKLLRPGENATDVVVREKRREDKMRGRRYGMTRFTWNSISEPVVRRTMADFRDQMAQSRRLYVFG